MRHLVIICSLLVFAVSLHASVPSVVRAEKFHAGSVQTELDGSPLGQSPQHFALTASPADGQSFYPEFYGSEILQPKAPRKSGLFHWLATAIRKTAQKVNLIPD